MVTVHFPLDPCFFSRKELAGVFFGAGEKHLVIDPGAPGKVDAKIYHLKIKEGAVEDPGPRHIRHYGAVKIHHGPLGAQGNAETFCGFDGSAGGDDQLEAPLPAGINGFQGPAAQRRLRPENGSVQIQSQRLYVRRIKINRKTHASNYISCISKKKERDLYFEIYEAFPKLKFWESLNVKLLTECARARRKIENENNKVLKTTDTALNTISHPGGNRGGEVYRVLNLPAFPVHGLMIL
jgi:hypothetical protein